MRTCLPLLVMLSACGGGSDSQSSQPAPGDIANGVAPSRPGVTRTGAQGTAAAENIDCSAPAANGANDVVGVAIGMPAMEAYARMACSNPELRVRFDDRSGFPMPALPDGSKPRTFILGEGGGERIETYLAGMPGDERVIAVRRRLDFPRGQEAQFAALQQQLAAKYGALEEGAGSIPQAYYASRVQEVPPGGINPCAPRLHGDMEIFGHCALSVSVRVEAGNNRQLARRMIVSLSDGAAAFRLIEAYQARVRGEVGQQQDQQAQEAAGRAPSL